MTLATRSVIARRNVNSSAASERRRTSRSDHRHLGRPLDDLVAELVGVPLAPQPGVEPRALHARRRRHELGLEGLAPQLAVGHHRAAGLLLERHDLAHRGVLDGLERDRVEPPLGIRRPRLQQRARAQQAPDVIGP